MQSVGGADPVSLPSLPQMTLQGWLARSANAALEVPELPGATTGGDARTWVVPETEPLHLQVSASELSHRISADKSKAVFIHFLARGSLCHLPFSLRHLLSPSTAAWLGHHPSHRAPAGHIESPHPKRVP